MPAVSVPADVTAQALFSHAVTRHLAGDTAAAHAAYEQVLQRDPNHAEAANNLASILAQDGDDARALTLLQHAIGLQPGYGEAHNNLGILWSSRREHARALVAFQRAVALDATRAGWLNNLGNAYVELFRFADAEAAFDRALVLNPADADSWSNRGLALRGLQRPADAMASLRRALAVAPSHVNALSNLGIILKEAKALDEAASLLAKATQIDPANAKLWSNYAAIFEAKGDFDRVRELAGHALELDPECAEAYNLLANSELEAGRYDASLAFYDTALALDPDNSNANWNVGLLWLLHGDFARGWPQFEWRKRLQSAVFDHGDYSGAAWSGDALDGRDILLHSEQGVGDAIQFVRYAALLKARGAGRVYLECPYPIVPMLSGVRGVDGVVARGVSLPRYDVHANLMSLPALLGTTLHSVPADVPYIPVEPRTVRALVSAPTGTLTVGFAWAGNPLHARDHLRSAPLDAFRPLVQVDGTRFFSLQKGEAVEAALAKHPIHGVVNLAPYLEDFRDTAAAIDALDLVITVDTSVAHLAGALGKETWLLLPHVPDFRWMLERRDSPWYPSMRIFRQPSPRDWDSVFVEVDAALRERVARKGRDASSASAPTLPFGAASDRFETPDDDTVVTLVSATRVPDGRARFDLWTSLGALATPQLFAEYEGELVRGGHDLAVRGFLDQFLSAGDVFVDIHPGLGLTTLSAATAPTPPRVIALVDPDETSAARIARMVERRAPVVTVIRTTDPGDALLRAASDGGGRMIVRVGDGASDDVIVDAVGRLAPQRRPTVIAWTRRSPMGAAGALTFLESLGYVTAALTLVNGEPSLDAIEHPDEPQPLITMAADALDALEAQAAVEAQAARMGEAETTAPTPSAAPTRPVPHEVSIAITPLVSVGAARPAPSAATSPRAVEATSWVSAAATVELGIDWELRADSGWGVYGTNLALALERIGAARPAIFAADATDLSPVARFCLSRALRAGAAREATLAGRSTPMPFAGIMLRALGNNFGHSALWDRISAARNAGVIFFEDTAFDADALQRARSLDLIVAGSHWNAEVLRAVGLSHVTTVLQGVDPTIFHPAPSSGCLGDRFVVFSGGKLEYRKGQDLVVAAFRQFRRRHPEALLLTAWHNNWPQLIADLDLAGHVQGTPTVIAGRLDVTAWLVANGIPADAVLDVGRTPNALMGQVVREADVALFPNRCEGGTNLVAMECMAAGVPTIVSANSGHLDLVATGGTLALTRQRAVRPPTRFYRGTEGWGESDVEEIVDTLEASYTARATRTSVATRGATAMAAMTWHAQVRRLLDALATLT